MSTEIVLEAGWWCWLEAPVAMPGWGASPVFVTCVVPLKTGQALLRLSFIQAVHPVAAREREVVLKVLFRSSQQLVGTLQDDDGAIRTAILVAPDYGWLETYCPVLMRRRPPSAPTFHIVGQPPPPGPTAAEHLDAIFGQTPDQVLNGAAAGRFGPGHPPMPARHSVISLDRTYGPFDSWMIARGFVPTVMEEKWLVFMHGGRLLFRRSWTGVLIYDVETAWHGDMLYLGTVRVNRDPAQYGEVDDAYDLRLLVYLLQVVLLGERAPFPPKDKPAPEQTALQAWSFAGKASL
jgi:hypothetical protein